MQFTFATFGALAAVIASISSGADAATCYDTSGCGSCESWDSMWAARNQFCGGSDWTGNSYLQWGTGHVALYGAFHTQQECWDGFANIIDQCYGHNNGGHYTYSDSGDNAYLDVGFCNCDPVTSPYKRSG